VEADLLARKPNYDFEKRRKEEERKKKKDAKREERLQRNRDNPEGAGDGESPETDGDLESGADPE
jgi:hypothetical protein